MKHGRKEQFSITIDNKLADKFYEYMENNKILYKNLAFEQLLKRAFEHIELMEKYEENQWNLYSTATADIQTIVNKHAPNNKKLRKMLAMHYKSLKDTFFENKILLDIP